MNIENGDTFQLGNHILTCDDSTDQSAYERIIDEPADLLVTDPPYGVNMENKNKEVLNKKTYSKITNDDKKLKELGEVLYQVFTNCNRYMKDDSSYYIFSPQGGDMELMMMMRESGIKCRHQLIWVKDRPVFSMNRLDYDYQHEPILYGWKKKHHFYRKNNRQKSSIIKEKGIRNKVHPTSKPPRLIAELITNNTRQDDIVLDPFGGGGTTLLSAEKLNRQCRMIEIDPHYVNVILKRYEYMTGIKPKKI